MKPACPEPLEPVHSEKVMHEGLDEGRHSECLLVHAGRGPSGFSFRWTDFSHPSTLQLGPLVQQLIQPGELCNDLAQNSARFAEALVNAVRHGNFRGSRQASENSPDPDTELACLADPG